MRGEYVVREQRHRVAGGSSPRAWGIQTGHFWHALCNRFIPTCVGNTASAYAWTQAASVHPHVRGEYSSRCASCWMSSGSSPRAWGILQPHQFGHRSARFIPTCVGNTVSSRFVTIENPVHPHVRGEYRRRPSYKPPQIGSSPRAWGIPAPPSGAPGKPRFIPTCVGNTAGSHHGNAGPAVHPHVRGEYSFSHWSKNFRCGSSPRAWGIHPVDAAHFHVRRFIPTCVGNTSWGLSVVSFPAVHPHVRGEYVHQLQGAPGLLGSSPRAWGIPPADAVQGRSTRFIPTCVGNTPWPPKGPW